MFTIYAKPKDSNSWIYKGTFNSATNCVGRARELKEQGYQIEIDSSEVPVERDSPYND